MQFCAAHAPCVGFIVSLSRQIESGSSHTPLPELKQSS
jgi:hypothetical protein